MDVRNLVEKSLVEMGADGLINKDLKCSCRVKRFLFVYCEQLKKTGDTLTCHPYREINGETIDLDEMERKEKMLRDLMQIDIARTIANRIGENLLNITHYEKVAELLKNCNPEIQAAALLHHVFEDTNISEQELKDQGVNDRVIEIIQSVSQRKEENYLDFILRVKRDECATAIKIADLTDNMINSQSKDLLEKHELALWILEH